MPGKYDNENNENNNNLNVNWRASFDNMTTPEPEFIMDKQRDTMAVLRFMLFERQRKNRSDLDQSRLKGNRSKTLMMLNWIAACFVTEPVGDVVSTAVSTEQGRITFYIAANRGPSRDRDRENSKIFKQLLRDTIQNTNLTSITNQLMDVVSPIIYRRLARKVDLITGIDKNESPDSRVQNRFNAIVDRWGGGGNVEDNHDFLRYSGQSLTAGMDGNQRLKYIFDQIVSTATMDAKAEGNRPKDDETRRLRVTDFTADAYALLRSKFFKSFDKPRPESANPIPSLDEDFILILRLKRRLWRVARYATDLGIFVRSGLPFIRRILGEDGSRRFADGGPGVEIVWVGDQPDVIPPNHGREVEMSLPPMNFLNNLFDRFDYMAEGEKKLQAIPPETLADIGKLWGSIKPFVHCEIQMILYLEANNIQIQDSTIGNSKLMCWACNAYVERANKERGKTAWLLSGTSEKPHYAWLVPSGALGDAVFSDIMKGLEPLVSRFAIEFGRRRRQLSGGLDSGTGSSDEEDEESLGWEILQKRKYDSHRR